MHRRRKRRLISFIRDRQTASALRRKAAASELRHAAEVLEPHALTIGFARRFATYKRATLLFRDVERLKKILCDRERPVQIVIAGKAHPKDQPGKSFIREIVQLSRDADLWKHIVFIEDYDMKVARELVQGVDLWLNTPRRGEEACGTSGMKAGMNGVLNLSVLDGWFDEAYEISGGWAIGDREEYSEDQDAIHASNIYYLLEREIVPLFYAHSEGGLSSEWVKRMKTSMINLTPAFDARRMVHDYAAQLYDPAHENWLRVQGERFRECPPAFALEYARSGDLAAGQLRGYGAGARGPRDERQPCRRADRYPARGAEAGGHSGGVRHRANRRERRSGRNRSRPAAERFRQRRHRCVRARDRPGPDRAAWLCGAGEPESLRRSADPARHQSAEVGRPLASVALFLGIEDSGVRRDRLKRAQIGLIGEHRR